MPKAATESDVHTLWGMFVFDPDDRLELAGDELEAAARFAVDNSEEEDIWQVLERIVRGPKPIAFEDISSALSQLLCDTLNIEDPAVTYTQFRR